MKIITEEIPLDKGQIHKKSNLRIGYLAQMTFKDENLCVEEELFSVFSEIKEMQKSMEEMEERLKSDHSEELLNKYGEMGWEIVGYSSDVIYLNTIRRTHHFILKREKK